MKLNLCEKLGIAVRRELGENTPTHPPLPANPFSMQLYLMTMLKTGMDDSTATTGNRYTENCSTKYAAWLSTQLPEREQIKLSGR